MAKKVFLSLVFLLSFTLFLSAEVMLLEQEEALNSNLFKGKIGVGFNWTGAQVRIDVGSNFLAEIRGQYSGDNLLLAVRGYYVLPKLSGQPPLQPYTGIEIGIPFSNVLTSGFECGVFFGGEIFVAKNIGVGLDAGPYFISISSDLGSISDFGIVINLGVTYYF